MKLICVPLLFGLALGCSKQAAETSSEKASETAGGATQTAAADAWQSFGAELEQEGEPVPVSELLGNPSDYAGKDLLIEGTVDQVCKNKGCWMTLKDGDRSMRVTFKDYGFFVPLDCEGSTMRMEGTFAVETMTVEEARHFLEDEGKMEEAAKITEPVEEYRLVATGVLMKKAG